MESSKGAHCDTVKHRDWVHIVGSCNVRVSCHKWINGLLRFSTKGVVGVGRGAGELIISFRPYPFSEDKVNHLNQRTTKPTIRLV